MNEVKKKKKKEEKKEKTDDRGRKGKPTTIRERNKDRKKESVRI